MLSLSTSWNSSKHASGLDLINEIRSIGFDTVELNFALTRHMVSDVMSLKESGHINISSLHNMCPLPPEISPANASPDYYSLSSSDKDERSRALKAAKETLSCAKRLGAKAIVLHAGRIPTKDRTRELASLVWDKAAFIGLRDRMISERHENAGGSLDNVMKSMDELVPCAKELGVAIGVENRYYYGEIPTITELEALFRRFKEGDLYYWHDVGHAEVFERLGLCRHRDLLDKFAHRLIGIHLHDIMGAINDHKPPGSGTFDFRLVKPYIRPDTIRVMEVHQPATSDDIRRGAEYLTKVLG